MGKVANSVFSKQFSQKDALSSILHYFLVLMSRLSVTESHLNSACSYLCKLISHQPFQLFASTAMIAATLFLSIFWEIIWQACHKLHPNGLHVPALNMPEILSCGRLRDWNMSQHKLLLQNRLSPGMTGPGSWRRSTAMQALPQGGVAAIGKVAIVTATLW